MSKPQKKHIILICDDEEGIRESFKLVLGDQYQLRVTHNGLEAIELLKSSTPDQMPDLMLLDIKMPKLHGMEIIKQVKKLKPSLPVIIVTGYQSIEMAQEALKHGAADYIPKPFDSKELLKAVARNLE